MLARVSGAKTTDCLKFGLVYCLLASILYDCGRTTQKRGGCDRLRRSAAKRSYPSPKVRGATERSSPTSKEQRLRGSRKAKRSYSTFKIRRGAIRRHPPIQGKEQRLRFAGAALKRYPTSKVRETQVRR